MQRAGAGPDVGDVRRERVERQGGDLRSGVGAGPLSRQTRRGEGAGDRSRTALIL